jgi:hypothetical protein
MQAVIGQPVAHALDGLVGIVVVGFDVLALISDRAASQRWG